MTTWLPLFLVLLADPVVTVRVWPAGFQFEPGYLRVTVRVARHEDNRRVEIAAESPAYFRSTLVQLDGVEAPVTHQVEYHDVPAGPSAVVAAVFDSLNRELGRAVAETEVLSRR